jgi:hypothetical protein
MASMPMASRFSVFVHQRATAKSLGIAIVRDIFRKHQFPEGVSTKQLYKLALQEPAPPDFQPFPLKRPVFRPLKPTKSKKKVVLPDPDLLYPPNPEHPIRSMRYATFFICLAPSLTEYRFLKTEILAELKTRKEITTVRQPKAGARLAEEAANANPNPTKKERLKLAASQMEFVWKPLPPKETPPGPPVKEVFGQEVGVGADISHLNERRQLARVEKVSRAVDTMKAIKNGFKPRPKSSVPLYKLGRSAKMFKDA